MKIKFKTLIKENVKNLIKFEESEYWKAKYTDFINQW